MGHDERVAEMLKLMDSLAILRRAVERMGLTFQGSVEIIYRCEKCGASFDDGDEADEHEAGCEGDWETAFHD